MSIEDAKKDLSNIRAGFMILDPDSGDSVISQLVSTADSAKKSIEAMAHHLHSFAEHLPDPHGPVFRKAAIALGEVANDPSWRKADDIALLMKAALDGLEEQLDGIATKE